MPEELIFPSLLMTLAFVAYSTGVWAERISRDLRPWHVAAFWTGLTFDAWGTWLMALMRMAGTKPDPFHWITGQAAFWLMALHAVWATWVAFKGRREARARFHRYSIAVWLLWLVPYFGGMLLGILRGSR